MATQLCRLSRSLRCCVCSVSVCCPSGLCLCLLLVLLSRLSSCSSCCWSAVLVYRIYDISNQNLFHHNSTDWDSVISYNNSSITQQILLLLEAAIIQMKKLARTYNLLSPALNVNCYSLKHLVRGIATAPPVHRSVVGFESTFYLDNDLEASYLEK
jgi:hypothetical protein